MSELQIGLLGIGVVVVLVVYGYSAWQQRHYRRRFGSAFRTQPGDALIGGAATAAAAQARVPVTDEACVTLSDATDYICALTHAETMHAGMLAPLWKRRFDFGKPVYACGKNATNGKWERVVAESPAAYNSLRVALQLADRSGPISAARLAGFRELMREMAEACGADAELPDEGSALERAQHLDAFCSEVDQTIGLNIMPGGDTLLAGADIARVAAGFGMALQADGSFHLPGRADEPVFRLANLSDEPFNQHEIHGVEAIGLSLQMDVPHIEHPIATFDEMVRMARAMGEALDASVVDDFNTALSESGIAMIRARIASIEGRMKSLPVAPGSALARRLFS